MGQSEEKIRVQRRTVTVRAVGASAELNVQLRSGGLLILRSESVPADEMVEFLTQFPLVELDDSLKS